MVNFTNTFLQRTEQTLVLGGHSVLPLKLLYKKTQTSQNHQCCILKSTDVTTCIYSTCKEKYLVFRSFRLCDKSKHLCSFNIATIKKTLLQKNACVCVSSKNKGKFFNVFLTNCCTGLKVTRSFKYNEKSLSNL